MKLPSWLKAPSVYLAVFAVAAALPAYLLRFKIGPVPMTVLEVVILAGIIILATNIIVIARSEQTSDLSTSSRLPRGNPIAISPWFRYCGRLLRLKQYQEARNDDN